MPTVLIIDDYEPDRKLVRHYAEDAGHAVVEANDAIDIVEKINQVNPDIVFIDIVMPEKEGVESILEIRKALPSLPIIAMSDMNPDYLKIAEQIGASESLPKIQIASETSRIIDKYTKS